jgi:hypothetical protein
MRENDDDSLNRRLANADRAILRAQLGRRLQELGGILPEPVGDEVSDMELDFLNRVLAWETSPSSTHGAWLARQRLVFPAPEDLDGATLERELWRLIEALAVARVFLWHTNHLGDAELYSTLWHEVLEGDAPDFVRTPDDGCHWDFADAGGSGEQIWLTYYASEQERQDWKDSFPDVVLPPRQRALHSRDERLPGRD